MALIYPSHVYEAVCIKVIELVEDLIYFTEGMGEILNLIEELGVEVENMRTVQTELFEAAKKLNFITMKLVYFPDRVEDQLGNVYVIKGGDDLSGNISGK